MIEPMQRACQLIDEIQSELDLVRLGQTELLRGTREEQAARLSKKLERIRGEVLAVRSGIETSAQLARALADRLSGTIEISKEDASPIRHEAASRDSRDTSDCMIVIAKAIQTFAASSPNGAATDYRKLGEEPDPKRSR